MQYNPLWEYGLQDETAAVVAMLISFGVGILFCFFGLRVYRLTIVLVGLLYGFVIFGMLTEEMTGAVIGAIIGGLLCGFIVPVGTFFCAATIVSVAIIWLFPMNPPAEEVIGLLALGAGVFGIFQRKISVILMSGLAGGSNITSGIILLMLISNADMDSIVPFSILTFLLAGAGIATQFSTTKDIVLDRRRQQAPPPYGYQPGYGYPPPGYYQPPQNPNAAYPQQPNPQYQQQQGTGQPLPPNSIPFHPSMIGATCPYCQTPIKPGANITVCSACGMPHHSECWHANGQCTTYGCQGQPLYVSMDV